MTTLTGKTLTHNGGTTGDLELCHEADALLGTNHAETLTRSLDQLHRIYRQDDDDDIAEDVDAYELIYIDRTDRECAKYAAKVTVELAAAGYVVEYS
jgi:hypothetical protein